MKKLTVIIDGAYGEDYYGLNFLKLPHKTELKSNTPNGFEPDSLCCIMNMLGVPPRHIPSGRAYLEALANGIEVSENDVVFRCNSVSTDAGKLKSSCEVTRNANFLDSIGIIPLGSYKNLLVMKNARRYMEKMETFAPHNHIGEDINKLLPCCDNMEIQRYLRELLLKYNLVPWGQACKTELASFYEMTQKTGCIVCKTDIVKGIAMALSMHCPEIPTATAEIDTDLSAKAVIALELSEKYDFTMLHINGTDEAAHRRNPTQKQAFIKKIDTEVLTFLQKNLSKEVTLTVTSDHATNAKTGKHTDEMVECFEF